MSLWLIWQSALMYDLSYLRVALTFFVGSGLNYFPSSVSLFRYNIETVHNQILCLPAFHAPLYR